MNPMNLDFTDTHTHLYDEGFADGGAEAVERAVAAGVTRMVVPATSPGESEAVSALAGRFPGTVFTAYGLHPTELPDNPDEAVAAVGRLLDSRPSHVVAVGEIGIDLYWDSSRRQEQMQVFEAQCRLAVRHRLPVIVHCREGLDETLEVLSGLEERPAGVFHCFCGTEADVERIRALGDYYFGIGGVVTFRSSKLPEVLPAIGLDRILLETDSPYLAPVPYRGKRNESAYLPLVAARVADCLGVDVRKVADVTTASAGALFSLP